MVSIWSASSKLFSTKRRAIVLPRFRGLNSAWLTMWFTVRSWIQHGFNICVMSLHVVLKIFFLNCKPDDLKALLWSEYPTHHIGPQGRQDYLWRWMSWFVSRVSGFQWCKNGDSAVCKRLSGCQWRCTDGELTQTRRLCELLWEQHQEQWERLRPEPW